VKTEITRAISSAVVIAALLAAAPCFSQDLNIQIPVPEPGKNAGEGKEAGKRKQTQRSEGPQGTRRNARPPLGVTPPVLDLKNIESELPAAEGKVSQEPTLAPPRSKSPRPWAAAGTSDDSGAKPAWTNPAGIPLRQKQAAETASAPSAKEKKPAAKASSAAKAPKNRGEGSKGTSGRGSWLSRWFQARRSDSASEESTPQVARRNRTPTPDHRQAPLAPPSPWGNGREAGVERE
jgi:hypothetical protein